MPQRITDTFLAYADEIEFYYRNAVEEDAQLAAKWIRNIDPFEDLGVLQIIFPSDYQQIKTIHNVAAKVLQQPDLQWESTVERNSKIETNF